MAELRKVTLHLNITPPPNGAKCQIFKIRDIKKKKVSAYTPPPPPPPWEIHYRRIVLNMRYLDLCVQRIHPLQVLQTCPNAFQENPRLFFKALASVDLCTLEDCLVFSGTLISLFTVFLWPIPGLPTTEMVRFLCGLNDTDVQWSDWVQTNINGSDFSKKITWSLTFLPVPPPPKKNRMAPKK